MGSWATRRDPGGSRLYDIPGEQLYLRTVRPLARADVIIDNSDPASPRRVRPPSA